MPDGRGRLAEAPLGSLEGAKKRTPIRTATLGSAEEKLEKNLKTLAAADYTAPFAPVCEKGVLEGVG